ASPRLPSGHRRPGPQETHPYRHRGRCAANSRHADRRWPGGLQKSLPGAASTWTSPREGDHPYRAPDLAPPCDPRVRSSAPRQTEHLRRHDVQLDLRRPPRDARGAAVEEALLPPSPIDGVRIVGHELPGRPLDGDHRLEEVLGETRPELLLEARL